MNIQTEWWRSFFSGLWLDAQRQARAEEQTRSEADFIQKALHLRPQAKVLDIPCGEGCLSIELASRGFQITGADINLPLLVEARRKAEERQLNIAWEHMDMRELSWEEEFEGAFCFWGSLGYFDDEGNASFLKTLCRALKPGGKFFLDTHITETLLPNFQKRGWGKMGATYLMEERNYDHVHSRIEAEWTFTQEGKVENKQSSIRIYTYRELCQLLKDAGFAQFEGYGSLIQEPFKLGSKRLFLIATKRV